MSETAAHRVVEPARGWRLIDWGELWAYRDLLRFLVWREVRARYAQSVLGIGWAVLQPLGTMVVFTVVFGHLVGVPSDDAPYAAFSFAALVPWSYFASSLTGAGSSLLGAGGFLTKVYFPRLLIPLTPVCSRLVDLGIAFAVLLGLLAAYGIVPTVGVLALPLLVLVMMLAAAGLGMWVTALAVQYRDLRYGLGFAVQLLMYAAPVVYPTSLVPERFRLAYALNPMVGVIEGFRAALLGTGPIPWNLVGVGLLSAALLALSGAFYFRRMEARFADVA